MTRRYLIKILGDFTNFRKYLEKIHPSPITCLLNRFTVLDLSIITSLFSEINVN